MPHAQALAEIMANTRVVSAPLVPEIPLRLLDPEGPWSASGRSVFAEGGPRPYWAFAWGSGQALARYLLDHPEAVAGKRVFEFGGGSGIASIAAARCGAVQVLANEIDPVAELAMRLNMEHNGVTIRTTLEPMTPAVLEDFDILLAADSFYHWPGNEDMLLDGDHLEEIYLAIPPRRGFAPGRGIARSRLTELATYRVKAYPELEPGFVKTAVVYRFDATQA